MTHGADSNPNRRELLGRAAGLGCAALFGAAGALAGARSTVALAGARSTAGLAGARSAGAAAPVPRVYARAEWGARPPNGPVRYLDRAPDHIVVHHTAEGNSRDLSLAAAFRHSRLVQDLHMDRNRWIDSGQQLTISRGGYVMEGRHLSLRAIREGQHVSGAQTAGHNDHTIGIENEGTYVSAPVPDPLFASLVATCAWLCETYRLDPFAAIVGHRDYVSTLCPGDVLYARLPELRRRVAAALAALAGLGARAAHG
jgi:hypothetical protein